MTAYATHADAELYLIDYAVTSGSSVTDAQIDAICVEEQAEVDGILEASTGYTVPITGTNALLIMKKLIALRAAAAVWERVGGTTQKDQLTMTEKLRSEADELLDKILAGTMKLSDAPIQASADISQSPRVTACNEIFTRTALDDFVDAHGG